MLRSSPVRVVSDWPHLELVLLIGELEDARDADLVELALKIAGRSGKPIVVDLSKARFLSVFIVSVLISPRHGGDLLWLAGPLAAKVERVLTVTGTRARFRVFPTLVEAATAARMKADIGSRE